MEPADAGFDADGALRSARFGDIYHARDGALGQARHVFLDGNDLPARWASARHEPFVILETGFGIGVNFLAAIQAWREAGRPGRLYYVATELHPPRRADLPALLAGVLREPALAPLIARLCALWPPVPDGCHRLEFAADIVLTLHFGDATESLRVADLGGGADALFLDGFAPQRNPAMWSDALLAVATRRCRLHATLATWCVAGEVRRRLEAHGWRLVRVPGFAAKRDMLRGQLDNPRRVTRSAVLPRLCFDSAREAIVVGAGIAGCAVAARLAARGWQVTLIDGHAGPAGGASGNHAGILLPRLARDDALAARIARAAFLYAVRLFSELPGDAWLPCGALQLAADAEVAAYQQDCIARGRFPAGYAEWLDGHAAQARLGDGFAAPEHGGWWFAQGGRVAPAQVCRALLDAADDRVLTRFDTEVTTIARDGDDWVVYAGNTAIARAPHLLLAGAERAAALLPAEVIPHLPLDGVRGQTSTFDATCTPDLAALTIAVCGDGYVTPAREGRVCIGASFTRDDSSMTACDTDHAENLARLRRLLPGSVDGLTPADCTARVGMRATTPDHLPYAGPVPDVRAKVTGDPGFAGLPRIAGLHVLAGLGSRGLMWAPLAAELVASRMTGEPWPMPTRWADALDPGRRYLRAVRRPT